jgi:hypothetical protein
MRPVEADEIRTGVLKGMTFARIDQTAAAATNSPN